MLLHKKEVQDIIYTLQSIKTLLGRLSSKAPFQNSEHHLLEKAIKRMRRFSTDLDRIAKHLIEDEREYLRVGRAIKEHLGSLPESSHRTGSISWIEEFLPKIEQHFHVIHDLNISNVSRLEKAFGNQAVPSGLSNEIDKEIETLHSLQTISGRLGEYLLDYDKDLKMDSHLLSEEEKLGEELRHNLRSWV